VDDCLRASSEPDIYRQTSLAGGSASFQIMGYVKTSACWSYSEWDRSPIRVVLVSVVCYQTVTGGNEDTCTTWGATIFKKRLAASLAWSNVITESLTFLDSNIFYFNFSLFFDGFMILF